MTPFDRITEVVLDAAANAPLEKRATLYRDLATLTTEENRASELQRLADDLDSVNRRHAQLMLEFAPRKMRGCA